jgi:hypothetical protein
MIDDSTQRRRDAEKSIFFDDMNYRYFGFLRVFASLR